MLGSLSFATVEWFSSVFHLVVPVPVTAPRLQEYVFASNMKMYTEICIGDIPFITSH